MTGSLAGKLLVATPGLLDPNFHRTVVLVMEHGDEGAVGVVLNRVVDAEVGEFLPAWGSRVDPPRRVFLGGPVQREVALGLAWRPSVGAEDGWHPVLGGLGFVDLSRDPDEIGGLDRVRVFSGYAGWAPEQLEMEIATGSWFVVDAWAADAFTDRPEGLWRQVLRRQRNRLVLFADFPVDPRAN